MDEACAAAMEEDGAEKRAHGGEGASENDVGPPAEDSTDFQRCDLACKDCGLTFTHWEVFKSHLHQHALEEEEEEEEEAAAEAAAAAAAAAQMGDNGSLAAEPDSGKEEDGENGDEDDDADASMSAAGAASSAEKQRNGYGCTVCGKIYTYLVSFRKHQQLHENEPRAKNPSALQRYECPECGMSFIRRARLRGHMRIHRPSQSLKSSRLRCDQCNKGFVSVKSWMAHVDLHKQRPFWCLSCAKGFTDEASLDEHLASHSRRKHTCTICSKSFHVASQLRDHYNSHSGVKPYQCTLCGKRFTFPGNLISHRKKHFRGHFGRVPLRIKKKLVGQRKPGPGLAGVGEGPEMDATRGPWKSETRTVGEDAEFEDHVNSEESDCGEPVHYLRSSKPTGSARLDESETVGDESEETGRHGEHKYWEWECCECDMGFDEVAMLHLHYIKHATGELPIPQDYTDY